MSSLARRITVAVVGITAVVVLVAAVGLWFTARTVLMGEVDRDLRSRVERTQRFDRFSGPRRPRPPGPGDHTDERWVVQAFTAAGALLGASAGLPPGCDLRTDHGPATLVLSDGRRMRVLGCDLVRPPAGLDPPAAADPVPGGVRAVIGLDLAAFDGELRRIALVLGGLWALATLFAALAAFALRRAVLRPLDDLTAAIARLGPADLAARLPGTAGPDEARSLVGRLNGLLGQLDEAFHREQATIAAIAHELRTPVAGLRTEIEFRLMATAEPAEQACLRGLLATATRMQAMVGNILLLARLEAGRERLEAVPVDAAGVLAAVAERWAGRGASRRMEFRVRAPEELIVATSATHLEIVFDNLVGNAVSHGLMGTPIDVILEAVAGGLRFTVANACPESLDPARLGTPFWRGDAARSDGDHSGLGLALCRRIARALGGDLAIDVADGRIAIIWSLAAKA